MLHQTVQPLRFRDLETLRHVPLFSFLSAKDLEEVASRLEVRQYTKGTIIFHQEDEPGSFFIVLSGRVKSRLIAKTGRHLTLSFFRTGGYFGPLALLDEKRRVVESVAAETTELAVMAGRDFQDYLHRYPDAALVLLERYVGVARAGFERLQDHVFLGGRTRLAKTLLTYAEPEIGKHMIVPLTQAELADLTATTPESVSRWMRDFTEAGLLSAGRGGVLILDPAGLRREAE